MTDTDNDIVERLPKHIEKLANTAMDITLADWGPIVNDILKAATTIEAFRTENASLRARVEKLDGAVILAANRLDYAAIDYISEGMALGTEIAEWADEARAALEGAKHDED